VVIAAVVAIIVALAVSAVWFQFATNAKTREAISRIEKRGGRVATENVGPEWLPDFIGDQITRPICATFGPAAKDVDLEVLADLPELNEVYLSGTGITDAGLSQLVHLPRLEALHLNGTRITDVGLARLAELTNLEILFLDSTQITDGGLVHLTRLTKLQTLSICSTKVGEKGLSMLRGMRCLRGLFVSEATTSQDCIDELQRALPELHVQAMH
jgi:hypothetical protein